MRLLYETQRCAIGGTIRLYEDGPMYKIGFSEMGDNNYDTVSLSGVITQWITGYTYPAIVEMRDFIFSHFPEEEIAVAVLETLC